MAVIQAPRWGGQLILLALMRSSEIPLSKLPFASHATNTVPAILGSLTETNVAGTSQFGEASNAPMSFGVHVCIPIRIGLKRQAVLMPKAESWSLKVLRQKVDI